MSGKTIKGDSLILEDGPLPAAGSEVTELRNNGGILRQWTGVSWANLLSAASTLIGAINVDWNEPAAQAAILDEELNFRVYRFPAGSNVKLVAFLKVPATYVLGNQINMRVPHYSPTGADTTFMRATTYLIRKNTDAVDSVASSHNSTNSAQTSSTPNEYREAVIDLTDGAGEVNSIAVSPGDSLRIELFRGVDTDTADIRVIDDATEVNY